MVKVGFFKKSPQRQSSLGISPGNCRRSKPENTSLPRGFMTSLGWWTLHPTDPNKNWLVVEPNPFEIYARQNGFIFPQIGMKIKNIETITQKMLGKVR